MPSRLSHEEFLDKLVLVNPNICVLEKYINSSTKIRCECNIDGNEWYVNPNHLLRGRGCPECKRKNLSGSKNVRWNLSFKFIFKDIFKTMEI
jgi:hypothetical protein